MMRNEGKIIACEPVKSKLKNLMRRAKRAGASNIEATDIDNLGEYRGRADCVLIDAPCSGMGIFRRNSDSKWKLEQKDILELHRNSVKYWTNTVALLNPEGGSYMQHARFQKKKMKML